MSKIRVMNVSMLDYPSKRYYGSADIQITFGRKRYFYINNVGIFKNNRGEYFLEFPVDPRSAKRNQYCIVPSKELRRQITDKVLAIVNKTERINYHE